MRFLDDNRAVFRDRLSEESPEWVPDWVDDRLFDRAVHRTAVLPRRRDRRSRITNCASSSTGRCATTRTRCVPTRRRRPASRRPRSNCSNAPDVRGVAVDALGAPARRRSWTGAPTPSSDLRQHGRVADDAARHGAARRPGAAAQGRRRPAARGQPHASPATPTTSPSSSRRPSPAGIPRRPAADSSYRSGVTCSSSGSTARWSARWSGVLIYRGQPAAVKLALRLEQQMRSAASHTRQAPSMCTATSSGGTCRKYWV